MTYNILMASKSPDDIIEKGEINKENAIKIFLDFPFDEEIKKQEQNPELTVPTITFVDKDKELAIWTEEESKYTIWFPESMNPLGDVNDIDIVVKCIKLFFERKHDDLCKFIDDKLA